MFTLAEEIMDFVKPVVEEESVETVINRLANAEVEHVLPVVKKSGKFLGIITLRSILKNVLHKSATLNDFMIKDIPKVYQNTPIGQVPWCTHNAVVVIDKDDNYQGVITKKSVNLKDFILDPRLNLIFNYNQSGILVIDEKGIIVSFNPAAERISRLKRERIIGKHLSQITLPVGLLDVLKTGKSDISKRQQYNNITFITNRSPIIENGKIIGAISIFQDISEFENLSEELKLSKEAYNQLQAILESSYDGFLITDTEGKVLQNNKAFERLTGLPFGQITGQKISNWVEKDIIKKDISQLVVERGRSVTIMETTIRGDKLMITGNPVYNNERKIVKVVINVRDLSELIELRKELVETKELVERFVNPEQRKAIDHSDIITNSPKMKDLLELTWRIAQVDSTVLIRGESGVGKELLAKFIYQKSKRYKEAFIRINCGAIPEQLLESELFGYESGAFTGAKKGGKPGMFELADKGTIFLDEIGELPIGLQVKLLRVLQEQEFVRVGGLEPKKVDVRVIAATNRDLNELIAQGKFRDDLYFRLNVIPIEIPPLRERKDDIIPLIYSFLDTFSQKYGIKRSLAPETINMLVEYNWPGNVRELSNVVERIIVTSSDDIIKPAHLPKNIIESSSEIKFSNTSASNLKESVIQFEKLLIKKAIEEHGSTYKAADALGIDPSTLFRKLKM
ncbi:MAG: sigma 54-interacting transcriptional regulator [Bacillota bacterium]|nr:sigma 54-interacting transcriptional regulator [Bacillota bacterium]